MSERPNGMYLACGFFALTGLAFSVGALSVGTSVGRATIPPNQPESVRLFLLATPVFMLVLGVLGLYVAAALWIASPRGRVGGLVWTGLWLASEALLGVWSLAGPEIVQEASAGIGGTLVRLVVGGALFYYLWTTGARYAD